MNISRTRHFTYLAMLSAMAIALHILESAVLPPFFGVVRIGLANIIALITVRILGVREMIAVNIMRVVIGSLLSGVFLGSTFWISLGGVFLSSLTLIVCDRLHSSLLFTAILSAMAHSAGQVLIVTMFYMEPRFAAILPYFLLISVATGIFTGFISKLAVDRVRPLKK